MSRKQERAMRLIVAPIGTAIAWAVLALPFRDPPALMALVVLGCGLIVGAIWCAIAEA